MNEYEKILVVFLASFLAVALVLCVIALYKIIQILSTLKKITQKAESVADKVENISGFFAKTAAPAAIGRLLLNISKIVNDKRDKTKRKDKDE